MKKTYTSPELEIVSFKLTDVLSRSGLEDSTPEIIDEPVDDPADELTLGAG